MFSDKCSGCHSQAICISPTGMVMDMRRYFLKVMGQRQKPTLEMEFGKEEHKKRLAIYPTLAQMGYEKFRKHLFLGKEIILSETFCCSALYKLHGVIDKLRIHYTQDNHINITITDIKSRFSKAAILQISAYGMIMSDPDAMIGYKILTPRSHKEKIIMKRLYPKQPYQLSITLNLEYYHQDKPFKPLQWMENNIITEKASGLMFGVRHNLESKKLLHRPGIYYLSEFQPCKYCQQLESKCSLYALCSKAIYQPKTRTSMRYFGKKQMLVKTKPRILSS
jgi:hypothetical protein